jgi:multiple sugar transport system permease protein
MVGFFLFYVRPAIRGFQASFTDKQLLRKGDPNWVGLDNYRKLIDDDVFWSAMRVTGKYVIYNIVIQTIAAILIAVLLDRFSRSSFLRTLFLAPWLMSNVVVALLFLWILDFRLGIANAFLDWLGIEPRAYLGDKGWVIPSIALINVWRHMGYTALLIFAGLQTIPKEAKEAALIDGCNETQRFFRVILPLLRPVLAVVLVITVIGSFQVFDTVDIATIGPGGPANSSKVIYLYIIEQAFARSRFGYASAMAAVLFLILALVTVVQMRLLRANESDLA